MSGMDETYKTASQEAAIKREQQRAIAAFRGKVEAHQAKLFHAMNREERRAARKAAK